MKKVVLILVAFMIAGFTVEAQVDLQNGLIANYPFNGNANDESGKGNFTTLQGGVALTQDRFGNPNRAYSFDGVDDFIEINYQFGNRNESQYSVAMWVYANPIQLPFAKLLCVPNNLAGWANPFHYLSLNYYGASGFSSMYFDGIGGLGGSATGIAEVTPNVWQFLVYTFNVGEEKLYVNNVLKSTLPIFTNQLFFPAHNKISIGSRTTVPAFNGEFFTGKIDDVRLYNRALNVAEINVLYNQVSPATVPISLWNIIICFMMIMLIIIFRNFKFSFIKVQ